MIAENMDNSYGDVLFNSMHLSSPSKASMVDKVGTSRHISNDCIHDTASDRQLKQELLQTDLALKLEMLEIKREQIRSRLKSLDGLMEKREDPASEADPVYSIEFKGSNLLPIPAQDAQPIFNRPPTSTNLPKIELDRFDGDSLKYWRFIRGFEFSVARKLQDDTERLLYLIYYCTGQAKEAIDHCIMLSHSGYNEATESYENGLVDHTIYMKLS